MGANATTEQENCEQTDNLNEATGAAVLPDEDPADPGATKGMHEGVARDLCFLNSRRDAFAEQGRLETEWRKIWQGYAR